MAELIHKEECYAIMGACFEVYKELGAGLHESVYHESLIHEFTQRGIPAHSQPQLPLHYKGVQLAQQIEPDFVIFGEVLLLLKAVEKLEDQHLAQAISYLKASGYTLVLLVNFSATPQLEWKRVVNTEAATTTALARQQTSINNLKRIVNDLEYKQECFTLMGACFEVYKELGIGLKESIYHESLLIELTGQGIPHNSESHVPIYYKESKLTHALRPDIMAYGNIILELKSVKALNDAHRSQIITYLKITKAPLGLLINFSALPRLQWERFVHTNKEVTKLT